MTDWMEAATTHEQIMLAAAAETSRAYLYRLASGARTASAELAGRLEEAAADLRAVSKGRLPVLTRGDLCPACAGCPYFQKCTIGKRN